MKKFILPLALTVISMNALSATTANLLLKGNVPEILNISVTPESVAANLALDTTQTDVKVATVNEMSNSNTGYKVTVESTNKGKLVRTNGTEEFAYNLKYHGSSLNLAAPVVISNTAVAAVAVNKDVTISYTGIEARNLVAGDYVDTITFTIAGN